MAARVKVEATVKAAAPPVEAEAIRGEVTLGTGTRTIVEDARIAERAHVRLSAPPGIAYVESVKPGLLVIAHASLGAEALTVTWEAR